MAYINKGTEGQPSEPFRMQAETYIDMGLSVIPVDGKKPSVKWDYLQKIQPTNAQIKKWIKNHPEKNIGIITGKLSNITVVDCDDPEKSVFELYELYGETPVVIRTPSGGCHLYYRFNGESNSKLKKLKGDIKADGGLVVAPPSYNPKTGELYHFIEGDLTDFSNLPTMKPQDEDDKRIYYDGERNNNLYNAVKEQAFIINTREELQEFADKFNQEQLSPPEKQGQVNATVKSVWGYKTEGKLFNKGEQFVVLDVNQIDKIAYDYPPALMLYYDLKKCHFDRKSFNICTKSYYKRLKCSQGTLIKARDTLLENNLIKILKRTKRGSKISYKYAFV